MIPLVLQAASDAERPFVTRLSRRGTRDTSSSERRATGESTSLWCGPHGLIEIHDQGQEILGDVVLVDPARGRVERLIRSDSRHNTLLVTEQCDQLCVMCSQPPKKTHIDRFALLTQACLLAPEGMTIGISGGEPTLHMDRLLEMIEEVHAARADLSFHVLSNGQHFAREHVDRLREPHYSRVCWGIPLYSADQEVHDAIVAKPGAFERLVASFALLMLAGARIELRTVVMQPNLSGLEALARFVAFHLPQVEQWSVMGLENIGFARHRWTELEVTPQSFEPIAQALDRALVHGIPVRLFNMPLCSVPADYRHLAVASISDWKRRLAPGCDGCRAKSDCSGFFEWHPVDRMTEVQPL